MYQICLKLTIKTSKRRYWSRSVAFNVNFGKASSIILTVCTCWVPTLTNSQIYVQSFSLLLTLSKCSMIFNKKIYTTEHHLKRFLLWTSSLFGISFSPLDCSIICRIIHFEDKPKLTSDHQVKKWMFAIHKMDILRVWASYACTNAVYPARITSSKLTIETLDQGVKYVQS